MMGLSTRKITNNLSVLTFFQQHQKISTSFIGGIVFCFCLVVNFQSQPVQAEGSRDLYPYGASGARANIEWRNSMYGSTVKRRTLLKVYANAGEYILLGSSAIDAPSTSLIPTSAADIVVYNPGLVTGKIGSEILPATPSYSCLQQRSQTGNGLQGRIGTRTQELAGPDTIINPATATPGGAVPGYVPCFYQAPTSGVYSVAFYGPRGGDSDSDTSPVGTIADTPENFNTIQDTSVSTWDVTVRGRLDFLIPEYRGRLYANYLAQYTGDNGRPLFSSLFIVTQDGYRYRSDLNGLDPNGFVLYANQAGYYDSDGITPLYHDVLAAPGATNQNQMTTLQGGVSFAPPLYPIFFNEPDPAVLSALGIPTSPISPEVNRLTFSSPSGTGVTEYGSGGTFYYNSNTGGVFELVVSQDGTNFDPTNPKNRVLRGVRGPGDQSIPWNGRDNTGNLFPAGKSYQARLRISGGELHIPLLDAENSINGGPTYTLLNPPVPGCPGLPYGCSTAFYDDRGYRTASGVIVGELNKVLCGVNPPAIPEGVFGYDSRGTQRAYGLPFGGNDSKVCTAGGTGAFGDTKGLDFWTFVPSNNLSTLIIVKAPPADPTATPTPTRTFAPVQGLTPTPVVSGTPDNGSGGPGTAGTPAPGSGTPGSGDSGTPGSGSSGTSGSGGTGTGDDGNGSSTSPNPGSGSQPPAAVSPLPGLPNTGRVPVATSATDSQNWLLVLVGVGLLVLGGWLTQRSFNQTANKRSKRN